MISDFPEGTGPWGGSSPDSRVPGRAMEALDDPGWGLAEGQRLVALAASTALWPLAFDWFDADRDPRTHLRRLSFLLDRRTVRAPTDSARRLGALVAGLRRAAGRSVVDAAADSGIDPVAQALVEQGQLREAETSAPLLDRLAWGLHVTSAHLVATLGDRLPRADVGADRPLAGAPGGNDLAALVRLLSSASALERRPVAMLGDGHAASERRVGRGPGDRAGTEGHAPRAALDHAIACAPVDLGGPLAAPTIRPDHRRRPGFAQVVVTVRDRDASPVDDLEIRLALRDVPGLPGHDPAGVTDASGVATLSDVWLPDLIRRVERGLRLPLVSAPGR